MFRKVGLFIFILFLGACDPVSLLSSSPALIGKAQEVLNTISDELKTVSINALRIQSSKDMNQKIPVSLDLVFFDREDLKQELILLNGQSWFKKSDEFKLKNKGNVFVVHFEIPRDYDTGRLNLDLDSWPFLFVFVRYNTEVVLGRYVIDKSGFLDIQLNENEVIMKMIEKQ